MLLNELLHTVVSRYPRRRLDLEILDLGDFGRHAREELRLWFVHALAFALSLGHVVHNCICTVMAFFWVSAREKSSSRSGERSNDANELVG